MSKIDPTYRNHLNTVGPTAALNDAAPAYNKTNPETVDAVKATNKTDLSSDRREMVMSMDNESGRLVTKIIESDTEDVVYQLPPDRILNLARELRQKHHRTGVPAESRQRNR